MNVDRFAPMFEALTDNQPFPWLEALYQRFIEERPDNIPAACNVPTGLGKTSVIAVWLIALATHPTKMPRRLVYVVNRRTVVDQTTDEAEKLKKNLSEKPELASLRERLAEVAISTLRGQFADNREWSADPSRPAIICGTVDMIGSRLLFSGYGVGKKARPLHAGFLGQDALLVHDEAHLEPAFQTLIEKIRDEQARCKDFRPLRVMELTATSRGKSEAFELTSEDRKHATVKGRLTAAKTIHLHQLKDGKKLAEQVAQEALKFQDAGRAVIVFVRTVEDVMKVAAKLPKGRFITLTGTMRGKERDELVENAMFKRFLPRGQSDDESTFLVCTSAGEVGVNISADHLVCDLSTFESMAQRFGRVNRFGARTDSEIHIIHATDDEFDDDEYDQRRKLTLALIRGLKGNGSPEALSGLDPVRRQAAFAPTPTLLASTGILFDAWALTTITDKLPGRPPVEPYLHGLPTEWQPPETHVAWREEVEQIRDDLLRLHPPRDLLGDYPLKPHELLREPSYRAFKHFEAMAEHREDREVPVWLVDDDGDVEVLTLEELAANKERIEGMTVLLPPSAGGLENGMLNGGSEEANDVADELFLKDRNGNWTRQRKRLRNTAPQDDPEVADMHPVRTIVFPAPEDDDDAEDVWQWFAILNEGDPSAKKPVLWEVHVEDVEREAKHLLATLGLPDELRRVVEAAAEFHDHGKKRKLFQTILGNANPSVWLAKSGKRGERVAETYRHEFGSLLDAPKEAGFLDLTDDQKELVLHLIATHHGRARPHFPRDEVFDLERPPDDADRLAAEVPQRFARLQRKHGRWGLAYLESLLRAADWAASARPSKFVTENEP